MADVIQDIHRELHTRVPGGFQAERLAEILEERHGGEKMTEILHSLQGAKAPTFGKSKRISEPSGILEVRRCNEASEDTDNLAPKWMTASGEAGIRSLNRHGSVGTCSMAWFP